MVEQQTNKKRTTDDINLRDKSLNGSSEEPIDFEMNDQTVKRSARKQAPLRKKTRTTSKSLDDYNSDSASVDSEKNELSRDQIMDNLERALKGDSESLRRLVDENCCTSTAISDVVADLEDNVALELYNILLRNSQLPVFGQYRWLEQLMATKKAFLSKMATRESRKLLEPLLDRRQTISDNCHRLRGKLDLLMGSIRL